MYVTFFVLFSQSTYQNISPTLKGDCISSNSIKKGCWWHNLLGKIAVDEIEDDIFTTVPPIQMLKKKVREKKIGQCIIVNQKKKKRRQHVGESFMKKFLLNLLLYQPRQIAMFQHRIFKSSPKNLSTMTWLARYYQLCLQRNN